MRYSAKERMIATLLSKFPKLKQFLKLIYQKLNYLYHKKHYSFKSDYDIKKLALDGKESYYGYYDKSPINITNEYIIFQSANIDTKTIPDPKTHIDIIVYDIVNDSYQAVGRSYAYNWQQGCKLMWIDTYKIIYNNYDKKNSKYISIIYDVESHNSKIIDFPIYDTFMSEFALSLNFDRLNLLRPDYGYKNNLSPMIDWKNNENDGIYLIDLKQNIIKLLISLEDVIKIHHKDLMDGAKHKFNHIMISPKGEKFMFLHRWFIGEQKFDALIVANIDGKNIKCLSDDGMVSHCFWNNENEILGYLKDESFGDKYYMIDVSTSKKNIIGDGIIDIFGDGHPNIFKEKIIFDTYPNKSRMKELYMFDTKKEGLVKLGEFFESFDYYGQTRCDLHPRFSMDGKKVFFDSVHEGKRQLYMLNLENKDDY